MPVTWLKIKYVAPTDSDLWQIRYNSIIFKNNEKKRDMVIK